MDLFRPYPIHQPQGRRPYQQPRQHAVQTTLSGRYATRTGASTICFTSDSSCLILSWTWVKPPPSSTSRVDARAWVPEASQGLAFGSLLQCPWPWYLVLLVSLYASAQPTTDDGEGWGLGLFMGHVPPRSAVNLDSSCCHPVSGHDAASALKGPLRPQLGNHGQDSISSSRKSRAGAGGGYDASNRLLRTTLESQRGTRAGARRGSR